MPVSHIYLTVSHLPTSCSFYLAALQPLGYHYLGQQENQIGLGINEADFFICQTPPGFVISFQRSIPMLIDCTGANLELHTLPLLHLPNKSSIPSTLLLSRPEVVATTARLPETPSQAIIALPSSTWTITLSRSSIKIVGKPCPRFPGPKVVEYPMSQLEA